MRNCKMLVGLIATVIGVGSSTAWAAAPPTTDKSASAQGSYVCPMHPQIQATFPGTCPLCKMALQPNAAEASAAPPQITHDAHAGMSMGGMNMRMMGMGMMNCPHCAMGMGGMSSAPPAVSGTLKVIPGGTRTVARRRCGF